jgi:hypothetical protein
MFSGLVSPKPLSDIPSMSWSGLIRPSTPQSTPLPLVLDGHIKCGHGTGFSEGAPAFMQWV